MNVQRGKIVSGGRLQLPVDFRRALGLGDGDAVVMEMKDGELRVRPYREALARAREILRQYIPEDVILSEELIADRRAEAERD
jgi:bifunctional DNA-binding transcriptional regulator/antitoxin component of YhaV-PrlF toxin-antitoxin module